MTRTLRETLAASVEDAGVPDLDLAELIELGERRLRRRRLSAVLGSAAAVVVVLALALGGAAAWHGRADRNPTPVNRPTPSPDERLGQPVRKIVYSDVRSGISLPRPGGGQAISLGDSEVETGTGFTDMDVTDDGFVYTTSDGRVWFSDGGQPQPIGGHVCSNYANGELGLRSQDAVMTANAGSLVAWFDCSDPALAALVMVDTRSVQEVLRQPISRCRAGGNGHCELEAVIDDHIYFTEHFVHNGGALLSRGLMFDVRTSELSTVTAAYQLRGDRRESGAYLEDVKSHPRGLVIGDTWQTGAPTDGIGQAFSVVGAGLVPRLRLPDGGWAFRDSVFDTATGRPVRLHRPAGYPVRTDPDDVTEDLILFEWLDDDTVALVRGGGGWQVGPDRHVSAVDRGLRRCCQEPREPHGSCRPAARPSRLRSGFTRGSGAIRPSRPSAGERLGVDDLDVDLGAVGRGEGRLLALVLAVDGRAHRGLLRVDLDAVAGDLAGAEQEAHRLAGDLGGDNRAGGDDTGGASGASPTCADSSSCCSWRMRASCLPCSSLAAW